MYNTRLTDVSGPCHHCPDRHAGCHGECEKYQAFRRDREEIYQRRKKAMEEKEFTFSVRRHCLQLHMDKNKRR